MNEQELHKAILGIKPDELHRLDTFELLDTGIEYLKFDEQLLLGQIARCYRAGWLTITQLEKLLVKTIQARTEFKRTLKETRPPHRLK